MKRFFAVCCALALVLSLAEAGNACTSIRVKTEDGLVFYARNMEGGVDFGSNLYVVPKGAAFQGTLPDNTPKGLKWTAKYGMVGVGTAAGPIVSDGLNEMGLAVGMLFLPDYAQYETFDPKQANITLAQYEVPSWILSNFATLAEVRQALPQVRVVQGPPAIGVLPVHYCVHDPQGNSLVIEYVQGKLHVYDNPLGVMTNSPTFDWMTTYLSNFVNLSATNVPQLDLKGFTIHQFGQGSGMVGLPGDFSPPSRFVRMVAYTQAALPVQGAVAGLNLAQTIIDNIDIPRGTVREKREKGMVYDITQWTVVGDLANKRYYFHTHDNKNWRYVDLAEALQGAQGVKSMSIEIPPDYPDVTAAVK